MAVDYQLELVPYSIKETQKIYDRIRHLYELEIEVDGMQPDDFTMPDLKVEQPPLGNMNRAMYLWQRRIILALEAELQKITGYFDQQNIVSSVGDDRQAEIKLWLPDHALIIDGNENSHDETYFGHLNSNYDIAKKLLDQLEADINNYK